MSKLFRILFLLLFSLSLFSEEGDKGLQERASRPPDFQFIIGPRLGVNYFSYSPAKFSEKVNELYNDTEEYFPVTSLFGINLEQRILLGETSNHFVFQELVLLGGLEQSIVLPSASILIGFRAHSGFEFGAGATFSITGIGVIVAVGWTFSYSEVYIPVDISFIIPNKRRPASIALTTGFNFLVSGKK